MSVKITRKGFEIKKIYENVNFTSTLINYVTNFAKSKEVSGCILESIELT